VSNSAVVTEPEGELVLEGIVTTLDEHGRVNIAPMGPRVPARGEWRRLVLRPFRTSTTFQNLKARGQGVFHVTDDVWLLARAAVSELRPEPSMFKAQCIQGQVLAEACRWYEFQVDEVVDGGDRITLDCVVVHAGRLRDFIGFNRAKHAVVEAAILATRASLLPIDDILLEFQRLLPLVQKTGGLDEHRAFEFLLQHMHRYTKQPHECSANGWREPAGDGP